MILLKTEEEISLMKEGGSILSSVLQQVKKHVREGVTLKELDSLAEDLIIKSNGKPSFKGHDSFPSTLCASVNEVIVHGLPIDHPLKNGDIVSLDLGILYKGFHTDMATTVAVGRIDRKTKKMIEATKKSLFIGIKEAKEGNHFGDISSAIGNYIEKKGFFVIRDLCGHGIGKSLHEDPQILNYGEKGKGPAITQGMVFCLEPMVSMGDYNIVKAKDGFGYETKDKSLSSHFEATVAVLKSKTLILTPIV